MKPSTVSVIARPCRLLYCVETSNPGLQNEAFRDQQGLFFSFLHLKKELPGKTSFFLKPRNYFKINFSFKFHVVKKFLHIILMIISTILWSIFSSSKWPFRSLLISHTSLDHCRVLCRIVEPISSQYSEYFLYSSPHCTYCFLSPVPVGWKCWPFLYYSRRPTGRTWANILYFVWLCVSGITTGTRRIMRPGELALRKTSFKTPYEG